MTNEEIKKLADGYYAGTQWLDWKQEQDTKFGWRTGFAYAIRQAKNISSNLPVSSMFCEHCGKRKRFKGDGSIEPLCTC